MSLYDLEPKEPMKHFLDISAIPRGSGNEKEVSDYVVGFGRGLGLETVQDEALNVIIRKPGTKGYEDAPRVIIQGHLDIVCEKNKDTVHDFLKDGIKVIQDGDFLTADGTTLGADNGIAVAMGMALLESKDIPHPPLTVIMTTEEETGLTGAAKLDAKHLEGKYLINLDSGGDCVITVGCAGGLRTVMSIDGTRRKPGEGYAAFILTVNGLQGGHSGGNINMGRANANKLAGRVLATLSASVPVLLDCVNGGEKENAIPREAECVFCVLREDVNATRALLDKLISDIKNEHSVSDKGITIVYKETAVDEAFDSASSMRIIAALAALPNGMRNMEQSLPGFVETSVSVGVTRTEGSTVRLYSSIRSSVASRKAEVFHNINMVARLAGARLESGSDYPAWAYRKESRLREVCANTIKELFGIEPRELSIHGGLECGLFLEKAPGLDAIAISAELKDVHSPDERLNIASFGRTWQLLKAMLAKLS